MARHSIFAGEDYHAKFATEIYNRLKSGKEFRYKDIMLAVCGKDALSETTLKGTRREKNIGTHKMYNILKKTFYSIKRAMEEKVGSGCIEERGTNRNRTYKYCGKIENPLDDLVKAEIINNIKDYIEFCQDSAGFIPNEWLEHFLGNTMDLLEIKRKRNQGKQVIYSSSLKRDQTNIELLPKIHKYIKGEKVLEIEYAGNKPPFNSHETLVFHPHILREYNGRWQLYGHAEGNAPCNGFKIALDRIIGEPKVKEDATAYVEAPPHFYEEYFEHIVGATHLEGAKPLEVRIRTHSEYMHWLVKSKKFLSDQHETLPFGTHEDGRQYGEIALNVEISNEFIGTVLQLGDGLEIVSPSEVRKTFAERIRKMAEMYTSTH